MIDQLDEGNMMIKNSIFDLPLYAKQKIKQGEVKSKLNFQLCNIYQRIIMDGDRGYRSEARPSAKIYISNLSMDVGPF